MASSTMAPTTIDRASSVSRLRENPNRWKNMNVEMIDVGIDMNINIRLRNVCKRAAW